MKLLVVESPNKVKKLKGFLEDFEPRKWQVVATVGHFRGLPPMNGQAFVEVVDIHNGWAESFETHEAKNDAVARLKKAVNKCDQVYLAADDDREGEAIAWHVAELFDIKSPRRVRCREITVTGVVDAIKAAGEIDQELVDAQRARALLDYMIGLEVSRRLWPFGAKSAGRLQSAALRILVQREQAIKDFNVEPFWRLFVDLEEGFTASVCVEEEPSAEELDENPEMDASKRLVPKRFKSKDEAERYAGACRKAALNVEAVDRKTTKRNPPKPFTTAALLGAATTRLKWSGKKTTKVAQELFEKGLVTYIRTDSVTIADEAVRMVREAIAREHPTLLPDAAPKSKNAKGAQAAHEAIRPTKMVEAPGDLDGDGKSLYGLIYERTLCSQMIPAKIDRTVVVLAPEGQRFRLLAQGSVVVEPGWMTVDGNAPSKETILPELTVGQELHKKQVRTEEDKTRPPPRFSEASLIRYLERRRIGRPSTYADMISKLQARDYVAVDKSRLLPQKLGVTANELVSLGFDELSREDFTAKTESALDGIAGGRITRSQFLDAFYSKFQRMLNEAADLFDDYARRHPERLQVSRKRRSGRRS